MKENGSNKGPVLAGNTEDQQPVLAENYHVPLYGTEQSMSDAYDYLHMVAQGSNNYAATWTAAQKLLNTYIKTQEGKNTDV